jgi:hypothetical protein
MAKSKKDVGNDRQRVTRLAGAAAHQGALHPRSLSRRNLEEQLNRLLGEFSQPERSIDTARIREILLKLDADIRSGYEVFQNNDYRWILERLTRIYGQGLTSQRQDPFTATAADYAQVIETLSHVYPKQDYSEAMGQLFCYMSRLFRTQERSWKAVYTHILSIPESVEAKRVLNRAFFLEIQSWAEAGVENLFSIRQDLSDKLSELRTKIDRMDRRIATIAGEPSVRQETGSAAHGRNVIDFAMARKRRLIQSLERRRNALDEEKVDTESVFGLIESDIREFEEKLRITRRAYFLRAV